MPSRSIRPRRPRSDAPVRWSANWTRPPEKQPAGARAGMRGGVSGNPDVLRQLALDDGLRLGAEHLRRYGAVLEDSDGGDGGDVVLRCGLRVLVDVELGDGQFSVVLGGDLIQDR